MIRPPFPVAVCVLAAAVTALTAAPPDVPEAISAQPGQLVRIVVKTPLDKDGKAAPIGHLKNFKDADAFWGELVSPAKDERHFVYQAPLAPPKAKGVRGPAGDVVVTHTLGFFTVGETTGNASTISVTYPAPTPVVPPAPAPTPVPVPTPSPTPAPPPDAPAPIPGAGLQVLMTFDPQKVLTFTEAQKSVLYGLDVRTYLRAKCVVNDANGNRGWQIWPSDTDVTDAPKLWQDAFKRPRQSDNWIVISNGTTGYEGPLPAAAADALALLKKYGGN